MGRVRLIAVDLDGTLLRSDGRPCPAGMERLRAANNRAIRVVLATGRSYGSSLELFQALGFPDPLICLFGAEIYCSAEGRLWRHCAILIEEARRIAHFADTKQLELSLSIGDHHYWKRRPGQLGPPPPHVRFADSYEAVVREPVLRFITGDRRSIEVLCEYHRSARSSATRLEQVRNPDGSLHTAAILARQANKGSALAFVCSELGIQRSEVMAIGDNLNDLPMFAEAEISMAMGNAVPELKDAAQAVAPSNDQQGVAWALDRYVY